MQKIYTIFFVVFLLFGCTSTKELKEFSKNQLVFGSGGGITNQTIEFVLSYDGQIEKKNSLTGETTKVTEIKTCKTKKYYRKFLSHGFDTLAFNEPGNMSYFIGYSRGLVKKKILWGGEKQPPAEAKEFYKSLTEIIKQ